MGESCSDGWPRGRLWILAGCLTVASVLLGACSRSGDAETNHTGADVPSVAVAKAERTNLSRSLTLTAEFIPYQEIDVMAKVAGYVKQINVDIGDRVHTGEVLATLEVPEMADDLTRAAASVELSNAEIVRARDEVTRAQASHDVSHLAYQRLLDVSKQKPGLVAQQELDDAHGKDLVAEAQLSAAQSSLAAAQERTVVDRAEQARYHTMYNYTRVIAPFDGVITARYANQGAMIQAGIASQTQSMPVVRLSQNSLLRLMLPVPESAVRHVRLGDAVDVRVPSLDRTFRGRVARFTDRISTATRTMETEVDVPNPKLELVPGMYANVDLELANRQDVLAVPVTGVEMTGAEPFVFRVRDGALERVAVKTGLETADHVEILSGLAEGDLVVVGTRASLKAGDKVKAQIVTIGQPEKAS